MLLMWKGFPAALDNMRQVSPAIRIPMTVPYMAIPVGAALVLINTFCLMMLPEGAVRDEESRDGKR